jgi:hypothetical protein
MSKGASVEVDIDLDSCGLYSPKSGVSRSRLPKLRGERQRLGKIRVQMFLPRNESICSVSTLEIQIHILAHADSRTRGLAEGTHNVQNCLSLQLLKIAFVQALLPNQIPPLHSPLPELSVQ